MSRLAAALLLALAAPAAAAAAPPMPDILPLRERAAVQDRWLAERLDALVPALMRRDGVDMWILIAGEYNEDPVVRTMLPATWLNARRRTILVFHDRGPEQGVERIAVTRYPAGTFASAWDPDAQPDQWARLAQIVRERDPRRIAVNMSEEFPLADGLSASQRDALVRALGPDHAARLVSPERLSLGWLETRTPAEMAVYPQLLRITHAIIAEGLSPAAITPGVTTADDLRWWFRERVSKLGLSTWFHPSVNIQRPQQGTFSIATMGLASGEPIQPGDLIHIDFGISYLGLTTDNQRMAYVLRPGETEAPRGLREGMAAMSRLVDIHTSEMRAGRSGNATLAAIRARAAREGIEATIYTHPLGYHGHGAGATIGLWDAQGGVPVKGDYPVEPNTAWSIELNAERAVPEWGGQKVRFMFEENGWFDGRAFRFLNGRQTELILIPGG
ncbi:MAG: M24 family metallopeptidase [Allosphingosinicella sp.]|uniref:M24 family metallopeptidase n=1 Tax=Allosphingosinicella sp. TaxID=2823234 RepID=UPI0039635AA9